MAVLVFLARLETESYDRVLTRCVVKFSTNVAKFGR